MRICSPRMVVTILLTVSLPCCSVATISASFLCRHACSRRIARGSMNHHRRCRRFYHITAAAAAGRRRKDSLTTTTTTTTTTTENQLSWEKFEFGDSPKWDRRFTVDDGDDDNRIVIADNKNDNNLEQLYKQEAALDEKYAQQVAVQNNAWDNKLDPETVAAATNALRPYVNDDRVQRIATVLSQRTRHTRFLFENPANPSNVWACLRTIEAFGIQHVDVIIQSGLYKGKAAVSQKRGMRTAMGSAQWLSLRNHLNTVDAVKTIKEQYGCRIYASDLNESSLDIRKVDWDAHQDQPICIVMGNEESGISETMRQLADETFTLPMVGFAESFNLSVATAITLAHLSAASSSSSNGIHKGPLRPGDLPEHEVNCLMLKGLINSLPQKRLAQALLRKANIELPPEINLL